ncbi:MAG TPA: hypothetical protein VL137_05065 [Polyangiaceae bacterium]|nr:hypothetical protein [Polyangiaceae bacterium]
MRSITGCRQGSPSTALSRGRERGTVTVEYVVVLTLVSLGVVAALVAVGVPLVRTYSAQVAWLVTPIP